jgi:hypothetical protein
MMRREEGEGENEWVGGDGENEEGGRGKRR